LGYNVIEKKESIFIQQKKEKKKRENILVELFPILEKNKSEGG